MLLLNLANLPYWIFLGMGILLFGFIISGGWGDEDLNFDLDADAEVEFSDIELWQWFGIGQAPLLLLLAIDFSLWGVLGWLLNLIIANFLGEIPTTFFGWGGVIFISSMVSAVFGGSLLAKPLAKIFAAFSEDASSDRLIGCIGTVSSANIPVTKIGQVDVIDSAGNFLTVSATLPQWATTTPQRGEKVILIDRQDQCYFVIAKDSLDEQRWLSQSTH